MPNVPNAWLHISSLVFVETVAQPSKQVALTIHVYEGNLAGPTLLDVMISGKDAAGNNFDAITDSNGIVTIAGQPGTWQFTFAKDGYEPINLNYNVTETAEAGAYLKKIDQFAYNLWTGNNRQAKINNFGGQIQ